MSVYAQEFNEKLIKMVQVRPSLFDYRRKEYKDSSLKKKLWLEISKETGKSVPDCSQRWRQLRDRYVREKKSSEKGSDSKREKKSSWPLMPSMEFLSEYIIHRKNYNKSNRKPSTSSILHDILVNDRVEENVCNVGEQSPESEIIENSQLNEDSSFQETGSHLDDEVLFCSKKRRKQKINTNEDSLGTFIKNSSTSNYVNEGDEMFCLSLKEYFRDLNAIEKLKLRKQILTTVEKFLLSRDDA